MPDNKEKKTYFRLLCKLSLVAGVVMLVASFIWTASGIGLLGYNGDAPEVKRWAEIAIMLLGPATIVFPGDYPHDASPGVFLLVNPALWALIFFAANILYALSRRIFEILKNGGEKNESALFFSVSSAAGYGKAVKTYILVSVVVFFALSPLFIYLNLEPPSRKANASEPAAKDYNFIVAPQFADGNDKIMFHFNNRKSNAKGTFIYEITGNRFYKPQSMNGGEYPASPRFSRDGKKITFASDKNGGRNIYVMNTDGSDVRQLTFSDGRGEKDGVGMLPVQTNDGPSFSPDGKRIIFKRAHTLKASKYSSGPIWWDIYEIDIQSGKERKLTNIDGHLMSDPFYFSDGERFVFYTSDGSKYKGEGIYIADNKSNTLNKISMGGWWIPGPRISWNDKIVFMGGSHLQHPDHDLFIYENGKIKRLNWIQRGSNIADLSISPDGSRVLFQITKYEDRYMIEQSLWIGNTDGTGLRQITVPWGQLKQ
jgi:Tol biopolymer transport system component